MLDENQNISSTTFVKEPEIQEISQNRDIPKSMIDAPQNDIRDIQNYLKNNDDINLLSNKKYTGPIDGLINEELITVAKNVENSIFKIINANVNGLILQTTAKDLKNAVKKIMAYKKIIEQKQLKLGQDQRIYELGKIKMKKK